MSSGVLGTEGPETAESSEVGPLVDSGGTAAREYGALIPTKHAEVLPALADELDGSAERPVGLAMEGTQLGGREAACGA